MQQDETTITIMEEVGTYGETPKAAQALAAPQGVLIPGSDEDRALIQRAYRNLLKSIKAQLGKEDQENIRAAFEMAAEAHHGQRRKAGEPYIMHPIEVARICVEEIGLGPTAVICALLHDVVEDTSVEIRDIRDKFGDRIARIVDGLTKLDGLHDKESPQAENLSKVLKAMLFDVRVVLIKMADRLHNLRTIKSMPQNKQLKIAAETNYIYAPLAHRLGLSAIKSEFQDTCLKITQPETYHEIAEKLNDTKRARQQYIKAFMEPLRASLEEMDFKIRITGRPKSIFSIWNKIRTKNVLFEEIYDLFAIRIIVDVPPEQEKFACWQVYSIVTDHYKPVPERLKDWITNPKANGYESLHITVAGPEGRFVEVQVRSERMDEIAERGFAAHWKYKGIKGIRSQANTFDNWLSQVRETLESHDSGNAVELLADVQSNLFTDEVHVFTPKGEMKIMPEGASALDFAFSIHSNLGCTCRAVRVNNRVAPIFYKLKNGDQIEVITDKNQKPSEDWLQHVITSKARTRIRVALKEEKRAQAEYGKEILTRKLKAMNVSVEDNADMLARHFGYPNRLEFLSAIFLEQVRLTGLNRKFKADGAHLVVKETQKSDNPQQEPQPEAAPRRSASKSEVIINDQPGNYYQYSFASCCNPVHGDEIFGFVLTQGGIKIHRTNCSNAEHMLANYGHRILKAGWGNTAKSDFVAEIVVRGIDKGPGVIQNLTNSIADLGINIRSFSIDGEGGFFEGRISLIVLNTDMLQKAILALRHFDWVTSVSRVE
jgi:GTP pyrophosphokinase